MSWGVPPCNHILTMWHPLCRLYDIQGQKHQRLEQNNHPYVISNIKKIHIKSLYYKYPGKRDNNHLEN